MARGNERKTVIYDEKIRALRMERERDSLREAGALTALPQPEATEGGPTAEERRSESRPKQQASEPDEFFD